MEWLSEQSNVKKVAFTYSDWGRGIVLSSPTVMRIMALLI